MVLTSWFYFFFLHANKNACKKYTHVFIFGRVFLFSTNSYQVSKKKTRYINDMITSTPKKAISYESNLNNCLIRAVSLEKTDRIALFGRSQWDLKGDFKGTNSRTLGGELQPTNQGSQYLCINKCFPRYNECSNPQEGRKNT